MHIEYSESKSSEGLFDALLNSNVFCVFLFQDKGNIILSNKTFRDFIGYSEEELRDLTPYDIIAGEDRIFVKELVERRIRGEVFSAERINHTYKTKDNFLKPTIAFGYTISYKGKPAGLILLLDISRQKIYEKLFMSLKEINQLVIAERDKGSLLEGVCRILVEKAGFRMAAIGDVDEDSKLFRFRYVSSSYGENIENLKKVKISVDENLPEGRGSVGEAYRTAKIVTVSDSRTDPRLEPWRQEYISRNIFSTCSIPIKRGEKVECILLIQSETPRSFDEYYEILKETQADISFALKHLEQDEKIKSVYMLYAVLSEVNQLIVRAENENLLFSEICNKIVEKGLFKDAFIILFDSRLNVKLSFSYGKSDYLDYLKQHLNNPASNKGPLLTSFSKSKIVINNDILKNMPMQPWREEMAKRGYLSSAAIPVIKKNKTIGVFSLYSDKQGFFKKDTYALLKEIMADLNYALDKVEDQKWHSMISVALNSGSDFIIITDKYFNILYVNKSANKIFGYSEDELIGGHYSKIFEGGAGRKEFAEKFLGTILSGEILTDIFTYKTKKGNAIYCYTSITPFRAGSATEYYITVGKDITKEIDSEETMNRLIYFDSLTNMPNKKLLKEKIDAFIAENAPYMNDKSCALAIINPVNFSLINHTFGIEAGNKIMLEIAGRIKNIIKGYDISAKWEADKFAVFLKNLRFDEDALHIVNRIVVSLENAYLYGDKKINISFNAGISFYPKDAENSQEIFNKAEAALFNVRNKGDNSVGFFKKELEELARKKVELRSGLIDAIANKEFILQYQPYFDTQTGIIKGAEALLRWKKPERLVPPMEFIPFLEQSGMITEVENWIIGETASKIKKWTIQGLNVVPVSINISPVSFRDPQIKERFSGIIAKHGIDHRFFNFEIVERTFMDNFEYSEALLRHLKESGFGLSIDDFGTGYSSLSYLAGLPFDHLKIDISFIKKMLIEKHSRYIVETIIYLSKKLGMKSVAEGVETEEQLALLKDLRCECVQGFFLSKPLSEENYEKLLA